MLLGTPLLSSGGPARRAQCGHKLKQIGLALHLYHDDYGSFPPAYVFDETGKPAHSWRVLLLPYLDYRSVYDQYNFDEPWDSPANRDLPLEKTLHQYHCPSAGFDNEDERLLASYLAVIGPGTSWTTDGRKIHDVTDGTNETVWLIEAPQKKIYWNEPRDVTVDEAIALLTGPPQADDRGHYWSDHILFVDGSVRTTPFGLTPADWRAMFTIAAGDDVPDVTRFGKHHEIDRYRMYRTAAYWVFWFLAALPLGWVWRPTTRRIVIGQ